MSIAKRKAIPIATCPRWQVMRGGEIALGPGKAELLMRVRETGSILEAAKRMGMSYMRAWLLVRTMNHCFKEPLVTTERGGRHGGGAKLTDAGQRVLALYQQLEKSSLQATKPEWRALQKLLRE